MESRMSRCTIRLVAVAGLFAAAIASCDKSPTRPTRVPPSQPQGPALQSIRIDGPAMVAPGVAVQFTATGQLTDGTTRDLTATVTWRSSDGAVLAISSNGAATAGTAGQAVVAAESSGRRAGLEVLVLPPGTFRLTGTVSDAGLPVADATVDLLDGSRAKLSTRTDSSGVYRLFGVVGDIEVRVTKQGYAEQVNRLSVSDNASSDFVLRLTAVVDLVGSYQLTVTAASQCPSGGTRSLPQDARVRTYAATVTQDGSVVTATLGSQTLIVGRFTGRVEPSVVTFDLRGVDHSYYYGYYLGSPPDLLDQLSSTSVLTISGHVTATSTSSAVSGTLDGVIGTLPAPLGSNTNLLAACNSQHQFVLTRR